MKNAVSLFLEWIIPPVADEQTPKPVVQWLLFDAHNQYCAFHF
ncbi:MAG: hypothetical protein ACRDAO_02010 [Culicoidibacterales bacterium]